MTRLIFGAAVLVLIAFVAGEMVGKRSAPEVAAPDQTAAAPFAGGGGATAGGGGAAPDISSMSPEERASRLFNRVMAYNEQGKKDSAKFFAPMAIQAYQMLGPLDAHARFDIGEILATTDDAAGARAQADSILASQPNHLLGLVLEIRAAELANDSKGAASYRKKLVAAAPAERAKGLKEYTDHARDIDEALKKAGASP